MSAGAAAVAGGRLRAPVVPSEIVAVGLDHRAHAEELAAVTHAGPILQLRNTAA